MGPTNNYRQSNRVWPHSLSPCRKDMSHPLSPLISIIYINPHHQPRPAVCPPLPPLPILLSLLSTQRRYPQCPYSTHLDPSPFPVLLQSLLRHLPLLLHARLQSDDVRTQPQTPIRPLPREQAPFEIYEGTRTSQRRRKLQEPASTARRPT